VRVCVCACACHKSRLCSHHAIDDDGGNDDDDDDDDDDDGGNDQRRWCGEQRGLAGKTSRELPHASV